MRTEDQPRSLLGEQQNAATFVASPYHRPVVGWMSDLDAMQPDDVRDFYQRWYVPGNAALVVAGDVDVARGAPAGREVLRRASPRVAVPARKPRTEPEQRGIRRVEFKAPAEQSYVSLAFRIPQIRPDRRGERRLGAGGAVGGARRLCRRAAGPRADPGPGPRRRFGRRLRRLHRPRPAAVRPGRRAGCRQDARGAWKRRCAPRSARIAREGVAPAELARVKTQWVASETYKLDSVMAQARELGRQLGAGPAAGCQRAHPGASASRDAASRCRRWRRATSATTSSPWPPCARCRRTTGSRARARAPAAKGSCTDGTARTPQAIRAAAPAGRRRAWPCAAAGAQAACRSSTGRQPSGAKIYFVATDALPIVDVQIDFDAGDRRRSAGPGRPGRRHRRHGGERRRRQGRRAGARRERAGRGLGRPGRQLRRRRRQRPHELHPAHPVARRPAGQGGGLGRARDRRARLSASMCGSAIASASIAAIKEANTKPGTIAGRAYEQAVYGRHPYGQEPTEATLTRIDVDSMRSFYARARGAVPRQAQHRGRDQRAPRPMRIAAALLARLPASSGLQRAATSAGGGSRSLRAKVERIPFASAQAHVLIGQPGYLRSDPDHFALVLGNYVLGGGGFVSRLTEAGAREARPGLQRVQRLLARPARGRLHHGLPDAARPGRRGGEGGARGAGHATWPTAPLPPSCRPPRTTWSAAFRCCSTATASCWATSRTSPGTTCRWTTSTPGRARMNAVTVADVKAAFQRKLQPRPHGDGDRRGQALSSRRMGPSAPASR